MELDYLVLIQYNEIHDKIKYLISEKTSVRNNINRSFASIIVDLYNPVPIEKILTFHNVIIRIKSVVIEEKINYGIIFLETGSNKEKSNTEYF